MSDEEKSVLGQLLRETLGQSRTLAAIQAEQQGQTLHLASIDRRLDAGSSQMHQHGSAIAALQVSCGQLQRQLNEAEASAQTRRRKCSETMRRLGADLDKTDRIVLEETGARKGKMALWKQIVAGIGLVCTIAGALKLGEWLNARHSQQVYARQPDAAVSARKR